MTKKILSLHDISLSYRRQARPILKDISFSVHVWEILSIIGLNWAWKSSLLKIIAWILKQSSWTIQRNYKKLSYVPQKMNLDDTFPITTQEFIKIYNNGVSKEQIIELLAQFQSESLLNKKINTLSWGELQKVLIVSALISNPEIILLDEPTAGIDFIGEERFYTIIKEVKQHFPNIAIILVSHNIKLVYKNSDKVICLHENNFCCHGTPLEVSNNELIQKVFWKYTLPYAHNPHDHSRHNHLHKK